MLIHTTIHARVCAGVHAGVCTRARVHARIHATVCTGICARIHTGVHAGDCAVVHAGVCAGICDLLHAEFVVGFVLGFSWSSAKVCAGVWARFCARVHAMCSTVGMFRELVVFIGFYVMETGMDPWGPQRPRPSLTPGFKAPKLRFLGPSLIFLYFFALLHLA